MALTLILGEAGQTPEKIETHADVTLEKVGAGFEITASHLTVSARVSGTDNAQFQEIANKAKTGCPGSKLLKAPITSCTNRRHR
jgi:osmotically inducible protein OsmC